MTTRIHKHTKNLSPALTHSQVHQESALTRQTCLKKAATTIAANTTNNNFVLETPDGTLLAAALARKAASRALLATRTQRAVVALGGAGVQLVFAGGTVLAVRSTVAFVPVVAAFAS